MLFKPTIWIKNVFQIDKKLLYKLGVRGLILDLDNTLSTHGNPNAEPGVPEWLECLRQLGVKMYIVSNNYEERVAPLAKNLNLGFISFGLKPLPFGIRKGVRALNKHGIPKSQVAIVGDQIFTDIMGGNLYGIKSILVEPFETEEYFSFKAKRKIEDLVFKRDFSKLN
ncbi:MAG: YqeG family HAD IIIA-type phosphatase [Oscillospiraceae bacterium]|nr:YqeG family HAD IIIA-type phosphatase [Oscillospiraceae bacterium]